MKTKYLLIIFLIGTTLIFSSCNQGSSIVYLDSHVISEKYLELAGIESVWESKSETWQNQLDTLYENKFLLENKLQSSVDLDLRNLRLKINDLLVQIDNIEKAKENLESQLMVEATNKISDLVETYCNNKEVDFALTNLHEGSILFKSSLSDRTEDFVAFMTNQINDSDV